MGKGGMNALHGMTSLILVTAWIDVVTMVTWNRSNDRVRVYRIQYIHIHYLWVPFRMSTIPCCSSCLLKVISTPSLLPIVLEFDNISQNYLNSQKYLTCPFFRIWCHSCAEAEPWKDSVKEEVGCAIKDGERSSQDILGKETKLKWHLWVKLL